MSNIKIKDIREIYRKAKEGVSVKELCKEYSVPYLFVMDIKNGNMYADLTGANGSSGHCY